MLTLDAINKCSGAGSCNHFPNEDAIFALYIIGTPYQPRFIHYEVFLFHFY